MCHFLYFTSCIFLHICHLVYQGRDTEQRGVIFFRKVLSVWNSIGINIELKINLLGYDAVLIVNFLPDFWRSFPLHLLGRANRMCCLREPVAFYRERAGSVIVVASQ